jgi:hypothetical protein
VCSHFVDEDTSFSLVCLQRTLIIPAQTVHQIENTDQVEAEWLLIGPRGIQFFRPNGEEVVPEWAQ